MNASPAPRLPAGWVVPDIEEAARLKAELDRELPPGHLLAGVAVEVFASADGIDDVLFRHRDEPDRFTIIHLSWLGRTEINDLHPTVEFTGTYAEFLADQKRRYGLDVE